MRITLIGSVLTFILAASITACKSPEQIIEGPVEPDSITLPIKNIGKENLLGNGDEGIPGPSEMIIQTEVQWEMLRTKMNSVNFMQDEVSIDFENQTILAYFDQNRTTGGYSVKITQVTTSSVGVEVSVKFTSPSENTIEIMTQPYHIVAIPKTSKPVKFKAIIE